MSRDANPPWYADGLRFECRGCGTCCRGEGYVWVDRTSARRLARHLGLSADEFGSRYLRRIGRRTSLTEKSNHDCIFWSSGSVDGAGGHCEVYDARPPQCRTFPFWTENLASEESWQEAGEGCGGMDSGRLYAIGEIRELASSRGETRAPSQPAESAGRCRCEPNDEEIG